MCYAKIQESVLLRFGELIKEKKLKPTCFMVYTRLLMRRNSETLCCFPSYDSLSSELGISKPTVIGAVESLETNGMLIVIRKKKMGDLKRDVNKYFFPMEVNLMNKDDTKQFALKVVNESYEAWKVYFDKFVQPMRQEALDRELEVELQARQNTESIIPIEYTKDFPF